MRSAYGHRVGRPGERAAANHRALGSTPAGARADADIIRIVITSVESPTFEGVSFGEVGRYEKVRLRAFGEVDPSTAPGICQQPGNPLVPALRALLVALNEWVSKDKTPPASRVPRADGTLVESLPQAAVGFPSVPGVTYNGRMTTGFAKRRPSVWRLATRDCPSRSGIPTMARM